MSKITPTLLHLAAMIDLKREKMETALTDGRRQHLARQLDSLTEVYRREYFENGLLQKAPRPAPPVKAVAGE